MKIFLQRALGAQKGLLYLLIIGLVSNNLQAAPSFFGTSNLRESAAYVLAAGMGVTAVWAIYERMGKKRFQARNHKLEIEVNSYKSDQHIKDYLLRNSAVQSNWAIFLTEFNNIKSPNQTGTETEFAENLVNCIYNQMKKNDVGVDEFHNKITNGIGSLRNRMQEISLKANELAERPHFLPAIDLLINGMGEALINLTEYNVIFEEHKNFIKLLSFLDKGTEKDFAQEITCVSSEVPNWHQVIDKIIKSKNNQVLFPYLFYAQDLELHLNELSKHLNNLSSFQAYPFQEKIIERAKYIYDALQVVLQFVSTSETLMKEKDAKVEYDRKEQHIKTEISERKELLRLETKERESKIAQQNAIAESKLLEQRNREINLANEKARIEKEKKEIEYKNHENGLQLARIHEGYGIQKALDANNKKWRFDFEKQNAQSQKLSQDIQQRDIELKNLQIKLSTLESNIKGTHSDRAELERYARSLELRISNAIKAIDLLRSKVSNPPFNPQAVYGLSDYVNGLQQQINHLKTLVS